MPANRIPCGTTPRRRPAAPSFADAVAGCLVGAAVGDALGAPHEGEWSHRIPSARTLLAGFVECPGVEERPLGQPTDDAQMALAAVEAVVVGRGIRPALVAEAFGQLWTSGQIVAPDGSTARAVLRYLRDGDYRNSGAPEGYAGNGPAARSAPLGLYFLRRPDLLPDTVAEVARITHADPRSVAGAVAVAQAALLLAAQPDLPPDAFMDEVAQSAEPYDAAFAELLRQTPDLARRPARAALRTMASAGIFDRDFDQPIITSFVIPTTVAAFWALLRHGSRWGRAVAAAIRLGGNVDSLGAIVGALAGVKLGVEAIPRHLRRGVHDAHVVERLARDYHALLARPRAAPRPAALQ